MYIQLFKDNDMVEEYGVFIYTRNQCTMILAEKAITNRRPRVVLTNIFTLQSLNCLFERFLCRIFQESLQILSGKENEAMLDRRPSFRRKRNDDNV